MCLTFKSDCFKNTDHILSNTCLLKKFTNLENMEKCYLKLNMAPRWIKQYTVSSLLKKKDNAKPAPGLFHVIGN